MAAFEILRRVEEGAYASVLLASRENELKPQDRALCHELVMGVLRRQKWLDHLIQHYTNRDLAELDMSVRLILRLGLYQLRLLSRIPASAAVNESVKLVRLARLRSADTFVNAVLRRATREPEVDPASKILDPIEHLSVVTSHPRWLIERWIKAFGAEETEAFAKVNNEPAPVAFRVVHSRASEAPESNIVGLLQDAGAVLVASEVVPGAWRITGGTSLLGELAKAGKVYLQDEASQMVAAIVRARGGECVLDLCSAPGSKATQIADLSDNTARIVACDVHEHRLRTVVSTARLQGLTNIHCVVVDGLQPLPFPDSTFDRVLLDAPCSGTGTLRRNPEIRWRISPADIEDLARRQRQLLFNAARALKAGGQLVYSTCSVELDENEDVVKTFLENNESFALTKLSVDASLLTSSGAARTWPHRQGTDGFFICAFERKR
jgi:16S rRNA (cytosine967-C5)-methyltransferase